MTDKTRKMHPMEKVLPFEKLLKAKFTGPERTRKRKIRFLEAYFRQQYISRACRVAGISRVTYHDWVNKDEVFRDLSHEVEEARLDVAEAKLMNNIGEGKETSLIFYLKTKGRHRGYNERVEITGKDGGAIEMTAQYIKQLPTEDLFKLYNQESNE